MQILPVLDSTDSDVIGGGHFIAHIVLKNDSDLAMEILDLVVAQVNAIQENTARCGIVQACEKFDQCRFSLAIFSDERHTFPLLQAKVELIENLVAGAGIGEGHITKLKAVANGARGGQGIRQATN